MANKNFFKVSARNPVQNSLRIETIVAGQPAPMLENEQYPKDPEPSLE